MNKSTHQLIEWIGWVGVLLILIAYALVNFSIIDVHHHVYQLFNLIGAMAILIDAWVDRNYQPVVLNLIWAGIALVALAQTFL